MLQRFDKNIQTSTGHLNQQQNSTTSMRSFQAFVDNMLVNIKRSTFILSTTRITNPNLFPTQDRQNQRLNVKIYHPAIACWRSLRTLQTTKVQFELRITYNEKLLSMDHYPGWAVTFNPPLNLLSSERAVESTVGFRYEQAKSFIRMINDLMRKESDRLSNEIQATLASLECHYPMQPKILTSRRHWRH